MLVRELRGVLVDPGKRLPIRALPEKLHGPIGHLVKSHGFHPEPLLVSHNLTAGVRLPPTRVEEDVRTLLWGGLVVVGTQQSVEECLAERVFECGPPARQLATDQAR